MKRVIIYDDAVMEVIRGNSVGDRQLRAMELAIMRGAGAVIPGTGGLKKIRCASESRGKSGAIRVLFADYPRVGRTYLVAAFGKSEKDNISKAEARDLASLKRTLDQAMERLVQNAKDN